MSTLRKWYDGLSPSGHLAVQVVVTLTLATLSAFVHQGIGARRGYKAGLRDGRNPATQAELDAAQARGHQTGYLKGIWANEDAVMARELYTQGILDGSQAWLDAGRQMQGTLVQVSRPSLTSLNGA